MIFLVSLPRKSLDLDPNKTPVKLCRFHQISEFSPFLFFLLAIQEQHSHMAFSGIWFKVLPVSKRNWQLNGYRPKELDNLRAFNSQNRSKKYTFLFKFFIWNFLHLYHLKE